MYMKVHVSWLLGALLLASCKDPAVPPGPPVPTAEQCDRAFERLEKCENPGAFSPTGKEPYNVTCKRVAQHGVAMNAVCIIDAPSCEEAEACRTR